MKANKQKKEINYALINKGNKLYKNMDGKTLPLQ